jgi:multidrug efflux pump subunit AcrA (membrane-fusion protein)
VAELENALALIPAREARIAAQIARSEAAIARARRSLENTTLTTPFDLRVSEVSAERFQTVAPGQVVIRADGIAAAEVVAHLAIESFRSLLGDAPAAISLADMMRVGPAVRIDVSLSPLSDPAQVWPARVVRIEGALDARARTVPVVVMVDDPYEGADPPRRLPLVSNMQVGLTFQGARLTGVIAIPETALHGGQLRVVGTDDLLELRPVVMAFAQGGRVVIAEGLSPGDRVVIDDIAPAIPGMALTPVEAPE